MRRIIFLTLSLLMLPLAAMAQSAGEAVRWQVTVKMTSPTQGVATFKARLQPGWHLYGLDLPKGGPKPTAINLEGSRGVEFLTPLKADREPVKVHDAMFGIDLTWWDSDIALRRTFKVTDPAGARIAGTIEFMGCNDQTCLPPSTFKFDKPVPPYRARPN